MERIENGSSAGTMDQGSEQPTLPNIDIDLDVHPSLYYQQQYAHSQYADSQYGGGSELGYSQSESAYHQQTYAPSQYSQQYVYQQAPPRQHQPYTRRYND